MSYVKKCPNVRVYPKTQNTIIPVRVGAKPKQALPIALAVGLMVAAGSAFAEGEGGFGESAGTQISNASTDLTTVGLAVVGVAALIFVIRRVIRLIGG